MCKLFFFTLKRCLSKYSIKENLQVEPIVNTNLTLNIADSHYHLPMSQQLYLLDFIKNKMLDDYLSQCSGEVNIPLPSDDAVAPMTKCFMELDTNMATALKTPKYGFAVVIEEQSFF
jgi:hypothetical protein